MEKNKNEASFFDTIKNLKEKIPKEYRVQLLVIIGYVIGAIAGFMMIVLIIMAGAGYVEQIIKENVEFGQKVSNLFTFGAFQTNSEAALEQENKYYEELYKVAISLKDDYNVEINTILITATLFYNRVLGDYNTTDVKEDKNITVDGDTKKVQKNENDNLAETATFYKKARSHIKTLARYQLVKTTTINKCGKEYHQEIKPNTVEELAANWENFSWGLWFDTHNMQDIIYTYKYRNQFPPCDYEDIIPAAKAIKDTTDSEWFDDKGEFICPSSAAVNGSKCILKNTRAIVYSLDWAYEGVYYYRLMDRPENVFGYNIEDSFIELYYKDWIGKDSRDEDVLRTVDGIYALYDSIKDSEPHVNYDDIINTGPWMEWKQTDPAWAYLSLGGGTATMGKYGCLITSIAMQMANSGTKINIANFNAGTLVANMQNGFDRYGNLASGEPWAHIAPNFKRVGFTTLPTGSPGNVAAIAQLLAEGYYPVMRVKYLKQHWVAIIGVQNGRIIMADPSSRSTDVYSAYPETLTNPLSVILFRG